MAGLVAAALVGVAFVVAPRACRGGLEVYAAAGAISLIAMCALPFATRLGRSWALRTAWALGFAVLGAVAWVGGLALADVRFICSLGYL